LPRPLERIQQLRDLCVEQRTRAHRDPDPERGAERAEQQVARRADAQDARERRRDGADAGDELAEHERPPAPALEAQRGLADARVRRERDPAQDPQHPRAVAPADQVQRAVADHARGERDGEQRGDRVTAVGRQAAARDQRRHRGDRHADPLEQQTGEDECECVSLEQIRQNCIVPLCAVRDPGEDCMFVVAA
jgi:hypothetical protein